MGETRCGCARAGFAAVLVALMCVLASAPMAYAAETTVEAAGMEVQAVSGAKVQTQADYDVSWYEGKTSPYTIKSLNQLKGLAYLVNSGTESFEGKTVQLDEGAQIIFLDAGDAIDPIGTEEHPFQGTFDGRRGSAAGGGIVAMATEARIQNPIINVGDRLSYVGLFGYAGDKAAIKNLSIYGGSISVSNQADGKSVSYVGAIAGYLGGSIENCYSSVDVTVTNNGTVPDIEGQTSDERCILRYVGGLAGAVRGDIRNCAHADGEVRIASTSNVTDGVPYIAAYIGGIAGIQGDENDASNVTDLSNCKNAGKLVFDVDGSGGVDRFGMQTYSRSAMVGGIVGFAMGNVTDCSNSAEIQTGIVEDGVTQAGWGGVNVGGIVGSLRGPTIRKPTSASGVVGSDETDPGYSVWTESQGTKEPELLTITRCANTAPVTGLGDAAGIAGSTGAFTQVIGCSNTAIIEGTRWNKPCPSGIVGTSNGDIAYCYNQGRCFSTTGGGYYASGITALLTTYNTSSTPDNLRLPEPQIYGCYVTGLIGGTDAGYRTAVIAGESDGFIHDNCFLPNLTVDKATDEDGFNDGKEHSRLVSKGENRGSLKNNYELSADDMKTSLAVANLNKPYASKGDWSLYYVTIPGSFPKLSWQVSEDELNRTSLASVATGVASVASPEYAASYAPIPSVALKTSDGRTLYQNADFRVIVDSASREIGPTYQAKIEGINGYEGELVQAADYTIAKADISTCTVSAAAQVFNWERQKPKSVTVRDDAGNVVDPDEYTYDVPWNADGSTKIDKDSGKYYDYINSHGEGYRYDVTVTAKDSSAHYKGSTTQAAFRIKWASVYMSSEPVADPNVEESVKLGNVVWNGESWDILKALKTKGFVKIKYTGQEIKPTFESVSYLGKEMRDGTGKPYYYYPLDYDYKYIYGNPNPEPGNEASTPPIDATGSEESGLACLTVRFTQGGNFDNYTNVFYEITPASVADDVKVEGVEASYPYTGAAIAPKPTLTYNGMTLVPGVDYTLSYRNNTAAGTATMTIEGKGNYAGTKDVEYEIMPMSFDEAVISGLPAKMPYTGKAITPKPTVKYGNATLKLGTDYTLGYSHNKALGTATVVVKGTGSYAGTKTATFEIESVSFAASATISGLPASKAYTGKAITPKPTVTCNGATLVAGSDYTVSYAKNKAVGTATVTVKGKGGFTGAKKATFKIVKASQPMTVKAASKTVKLAKVKKKAQTISPFTVKKAVGKVTYKNVSTNKTAKKFKISAKGKVTVPKGTKKGSYKLKVKVSAKGSAGYKAGSKIVTATVKVK